MMKRHNIPESELRDLYLVQEWSMAEIAELYGVSYSIIYNRMLEYGIPVRGYGEANRLTREREMRAGNPIFPRSLEGHAPRATRSYPTKEKLISLIKAGYSAYTIGEHFGISRASAQYWITKYGLKTVEGQRWVEKPKSPHRAIQDFFKVPLDTTITGEILHKNFAVLECGHNKPLRYETYRKLLGQSGATVTCPKCAITDQET